MPMPTSLCFHGEGNAAMAATRMMTASMPSQPGAIATAKPLLWLWITMPCEMTSSSNNWTRNALTWARTPVNGSVTQSCMNCVMRKLNRPPSKAMKSMKKRSMRRAIHRAGSERDRNASIAA